MKKIIQILTILLISHAHAQCWRQMETGFYHVVAIADDGTLWGWGQNDLGQLGNETGNTPIPFQISTDTDWKYASAGVNHSIVLKNNGTLWGCGLGYSDYLTQIGTDSDWKAIDCGISSNVALKNDGSLWAWGDNSHGQLGNVGIDNSALPIRIGTDNDWASIASGSIHCFAIKTNGTLWAWGYNYFGQIGDGTTEDRYTPVQVGTDKTWVFICGGYGDSHAITADHQLWGWGYNEFGGLGNSNYLQQHLPVQVGNDEDWVDVSSGNGHSLALKSDGSLWSTGFNDFGSLGIGETPQFINVYQQVALANVISVEAGGIQSVVMDSEQKLYWWGNNYGLNSPNSERSTPQFVDCPEALSIDELGTAVTFHIYPNPSGDFLNIGKNDNQPIDKVTIYDLTGKIIMEQSENISQINVRSLPQGMYCIQIQSQDKTTIQKFIKE